MAIITGVSFPKIFDRNTKTAILVSDHELVQKYLRILILSGITEYMSDPQYGCRLNMLMFSPNDRIIIDEVKDYIVQAITTYARSITVRFSDITITQDQDSINITVAYTLNSDSSRASLQLHILNSEVISENG